LSLHLITKIGKMRLLIALNKLKLIKTIKLLEIGEN
jgi:hypothetical protein